MLYILARTASGRPSLMHKLGTANRTLCGLDITQWSRAYLETPIAQILCKKCGAH